MEQFLYDELTIFLCMHWGKINLKTQNNNNNKIILKTVLDLKYYIKFLRLCPINPC